MDRADLEINRDIRKVLVRHWIDLGQLSVRSTSGRVSIRGSLRRIEGFNEELTGPIVDRMFADVRRLPAISRVAIELDNWTNAGGLWKSTHETLGKERVARDAAPSDAVFDADKPPST